MGNSFDNGHFELPAWKDFCLMADGIWEREYYTNHGPLLTRLEASLAQLLGVKHAVCMTNGSIALMIALKAVEASGEVILPAFSHVNVAQSVIWAGLQPKCCDSVTGGFSIDPVLLKAALNKDTGAVIGINMFGDACDIEELCRLKEQAGVKLIFISDAAFGQRYNGKLF